MEDAQIKSIERFVAAQRDALKEDFRQQLSLYGIGSNGKLLPEESLEHLPEDERRVARQLRQSLEHKASAMKRPAALGALLREQAFTVLNRMVAIRMAEERGVIPGTLADGMSSDGFQVYSNSTRRSSIGEFEWYRHYLDAVFDELATELPVLFDRFRGEGLLFPKQNVFFDLLKAMNAAELTAVWSNDETLGWVYQYFNDREERKKMRDKGDPSDSYELAVRNQFFTPRYVVRFLVDNSLGRLWAEWTGDRSALSGQATMRALGPDDELPERTPRDPRTIRVMDPACGSMHFGLYAFDLLASLYEDAWNRAADAEWLEDFAGDYPNLDALQRDIPRLIVEGNLLGIDIDRRATQIAGLTLWLRAHRYWQDHGISIEDRPRIERVRLATAQPMPGEDEYFREFTETLKPPALKGLATALREELSRADVVGSLLQVEETVEKQIAKLRSALQRYEREEGNQGGLFEDEHRDRVARTYGADFSGLKGQWEKLEELLYGSLRSFVRSDAAGAESYRQSLFADDTEAGLAFVDLLREPYDVVLMNPPFGASASEAKQYITKHYPRTKNDLYAAFVEAFLHRLRAGGYLGAITSRTGFFLSTFTRWREEILLGEAEPVVMADLGFGVLDAMVETAAYVLRSRDGLPGR